MSLSPDAEEIIRQLTDRNNAEQPRDFPRDLDQAARPGMYAWWGDDEAGVVLGEEIGTSLPSLLYAGQTGATKRPSGVRSSATLEHLDPPLNLGDCLPSDVRVRITERRRILRR
jgi:hypothetical protein